MKKLLQITKKSDIIILSKDNSQRENGKVKPEGKGGHMETLEMTEKEMQSVKMSTLYELRLIFTQGEKKEYTTEEIVELLDKIATAKDQK